MSRKRTTPSANPDEQLSFCFYEANRKPSLRKSVEKEFTNRAPRKRPKKPPSNRAGWFESLFRFLKATEVVVSLVNKIHSFFSCSFRFFYMVVFKNDRTKKIQAFKHSEY